MRNHIILTLAIIVIRLYAHAHVALASNALSETRGNVRWTKFRFTRRVIVMHDDLHGGRFAFRVIYRLTFMFTYRNARSAPFEGIVLLILCLTSIPFLC